VNESHDVGHRLRDHTWPERPRRTERLPVVIVGGGIAGLAAAWRFSKRGFQDFALLEMEPQVGGNSRWGENEVSAYPWAAHYVPLPNREATLTRELFEDLGLLKDGVWEERHLCHSPQERLFLHGRWREGLEPPANADAREFALRMTEFRATSQFTIPIDVGAKPSLLDRVSMRQWLLDQGLKSRYLHWYVDYACRDDYGAGSAATSAWAGIHYFASRQHEEKGPLTWPEGNGWIVRRLLERVGRWVRTGAAVYRIERAGNRWRVLTPETEYVAEAVIFAAPTFLAHYLIEGAPPAWEFEYSPWLTANLTLDRLPRETGLEPAWDNVIYGSPSLGYVVATHQSLAAHTEKTVWTFYWALAGVYCEARRKEG
jgi:glycine/D-amino acid oxidase-like deaminating enzyme